MPRTTPSARTESGRGHLFGAVCFRTRTRPSEARSRMARDLDRHAAEDGEREGGGARLKAIDLFAGAGGFTAGAERAGARVLWAANHWPAAVACHASNHPHIEHACQDLRQADFTRLPRFDLLLAS